MSRFVFVAAEYPPFPGGIATYSHSLASVLAESGSEVTVFAPRYENFDAIDDLNIKVIRTHGHHRYSPFCFLIILWRLILMEPGYRLFCADIRSAIVARLFFAISGIPYISAVHGSETLKLSRGGFASWVARKALAGSQKIVANSNYTLRSLASVFPCDDRCVVSYLGIDQSWFEDPVDGEDVADLRECLAGGSVLCTVGRVEPRKGHLDAIRCISLLDKKHAIPNLIYVIIGHIEDTTYLSDILKLAKTESVRVIHLGVASKNRIKYIYRRAICHLLLAREVDGKVEGFGLTALEAAAQFCPTVAFGVGGIPEALDGHGFIVDVGDVEAAAECARALQSNAAFRAARGEQAQTVASEFNWARTAAETFGVDIRHVVAAKT